MILALLLAASSQVVAVLEFRGLLRLQFSLRHCSSSVTSGVTILDQTETVVAAQAGLSLTF